MPATIEATDPVEAIEALEALGVPGTQPDAKDTKPQASLPWSLTAQSLDKLLDVERRADVRRHLNDDWYVVRLGDAIKQVRTQNIQAYLGRDINAILLVYDEDMEWKGDWAQHVDDLGVSLCDPDSLNASNVPEDMCTLDMSGGKIAHELSVRPDGERLIARLLEWISDRNDLAHDIGRSRTVQYWRLNDLPVAADPQPTSIDLGLSVDGAPFLRRPP